MLLQALGCLCPPCGVLLLRGGNTTYSCIFSGIFTMVFFFSGWFEFQLVFVAGRFAVFCR